MKDYSEQGLEDNWILFIVEVRIMTSNLYVATVLASGRL